jgi:hypothetical protein
LIVYILAIPSLLYGCEIWTLKHRDVRRLKIMEMKFMRDITGCRFIRPLKKWRHYRGT